MWNTNDFIASITQKLLAYEVLLPNQAALKPLLMNWSHTTPCRPTIWLTNKNQRQYLTMNRTYRHGSAAGCCGPMPVCAVYFEMLSQTPKIHTINAHPNSGISVKPYPRHMLSLFLTVACEHNPCSIFLLAQPLFCSTSLLLP